MLPAARKPNGNRRTGEPAGRRPARDPLPGAWIDLLGRALEGAYGDAGIRQYQAGLVVDQPTGEVEGWRGVVVALVPVLVCGPCVLLLEACHAQIQSSYVGGRRLRPSHRG